MDDRSIFLFLIANGKYFEANMTKKKSDEVDVYVGLRMRMRRIAMGMSQTKLASKLGITYQQVQKYEKGINRVGASRLDAAAHVLGVEPAFFFEGRPETALNRASAQADKNGYDILEFMKSHDGFALNQAFPRIADPTVRRNVIALVKTLAGGDFETDRRED